MSCTTISVRPISTCGDSTGGTTVTVTVTAVAVAVEVEVEVAALTSTTTGAPGRRGCDPPERRA